MYRIREKIKYIFPYFARRWCYPGRRATLIHQPIRSIGVQTSCRRQSIFINRSAVTSPGTCVTVNAHSTERCGTLSLSMTDITHNRTSRWLLRIPYGNVAWPISRTVHLWNWHCAKRPCFTALARPALSQNYTAGSQNYIAENSSNIDENLFTNASDWDTIIKSKRMSNCLTDGLLQRAHNFCLQEKQILFQYVLNNLTRWINKLNVYKREL